MNAYEPFDESDELHEGQVVQSPIYPGVALHAFGWQTIPNEDGWDDGFEKRTGRVLCVMVGDDSSLYLDPSDLSPIDRKEYCGECGQIGCHCDAHGDE